MITKGGLFHSNKNRRGVQRDEPLRNPASIGPGVVSTAAAQTPARLPFDPAEFPPVPSGPRIPTAWMSWKSPPERQGAGGKQRQAKKKRRGGVEKRHRAKRRGAATKETRHGTRRPSDKLDDPPKKRKKDWTSGRHTEARRRSPVNRSILLRKHQRRSWAWVRLSNTLWHIPFRVSRIG